MSYRISNLIISCVVFLLFIGVLQSIAAIPPPADPAVLLAVQKIGDEAVNTHNADLATTIITDDMVYDYVPQPTPYVGKEGMAGFLNGIFKPFPDFHVDYIRPPLVSGNIVVVEHLTTGTHSGELDMGALGKVPPTGKKFQTVHMDILEFEGDKMKKVTTYDDVAIQMIQLGLLPASAMPELKPSFTLPAPEPTKLVPLAATTEGMTRWNTHDMALWAKMVSTNAQFTIAALGGVPMSRDMFVASQELYFLAFPDVQVKPVRLIDMGGGWILNEVVYKGTHKGPYFGIPATGRPFEVRAVFLTRFDSDGLMTNLYAYFDNLTILAQLGLLQPPGPTPEETNKTLVKSFFDEVWNKGNVASIVKFISPDMIGHLPEGESTGIEGEKNHVLLYLSAFPDLKITINDMIAQGDKVTVRFTLQGTHKGLLMGTIPPTGKQITGTGNVIFKITEGKITEAWSYADMLGVMQQLGVITPGRPGYTWGELSKTTGSPGSPETNKAFIRRYLEEVWNQKKLGILDEVMASDVINHDPVLYPGEKDLKTHRQIITMYFTAFPDIHITFDDIIAEGDKVSVRGTITGTHKSGLMGAPATGKQVTWKAIAIFRFANGKIVEAWWAYDAMGIMQQITVPTKPIPVPEGLILDKITSLSLKGNFIGDPATREMAIYLPPSYDKGGRFPVVYLLHGYPGDERIFFSKDHPYWLVPPDFPEKGFAGMLDDLITTGKLKEMIIVMPNGKNKYGGSFYTNSELTGNYEDYIAKDLVSYIDSHYRTIPNRNSRAIIGHSMGGYGAMKLAMKHPDIFGAVAVHGAPLFFEAIKPMMPLVVAENPDGMIGPHPERLFTSLGYSMSAAFSPNLEYPPFFVDLPFEYPTGLTIDEVWSKWLKHDHYTMLGLYSKNMASLNGIYLDCGDKDEYGVFIHADMFHKALVAAGIKHEYKAFTGGHYERFFERLNISLPFISDALSTGEVTEDYSNVFFMSMKQGLNMISLPLKPFTSYTAKSFAEYISATMVIRYDELKGNFEGFVPIEPAGDGFPIEGGKGYIVNVTKDTVVAFVGAAWTNNPPVVTAPPIQINNTWAFVVNGLLLDGEMIRDRNEDYTVKVKNLRTGAIVSESADVENGYFSAAWADLNRKSVIEAGDKLEVSVIDSRGKSVSGPFVHEITLDDIRNAVKNVQLRLGAIIPEKSALLQNYPNPFNPETWMPYQLNTANPVKIRIYNASGQLIRTLDIGFKEAGLYVSHSKAAYWDGKNEAGEAISSGVYFYTIQAGDYTATKKMVITR